MNDWGTNSFNRIMREHEEEMRARLRFAIPYEQRPPKAITYFASPDPDRPVQQFEWNTDIISKFAHVPGEPVVKERWRWGILFRLGSCWIGAHYAPHNKRVCINLVPFITIWITAPGGRVP